MGATTKRYDTSYKKRTDTDRDSYLPLRSPVQVIRCAGCGAFYYRRRWSLSSPAGFGNTGVSRRIYCPACRKIKDRRASGELHLAGVAPHERREVLQILRNEEARAREKNPLERIMAVEQTNGHWKIQTTTEKLAQRLGRSMKKAKSGKISYKWSHNNKFVRVVWENGSSLRTGVS